MKPEHLGSGFSYINSKSVTNYIHSYKQNLGTGTGALNKQSITVCSQIHAYIFGQRHSFGNLVLHNSLMGLK